VTHQTFDQAVVGPTDFVFRAGRPDTVDRASVPIDFDYIAAGHIHRYQLLDHPLKPGLVFAYPGSPQRMSFAEMNEEKGFIQGEIVDGHIATRFIPLPAYEMETVEIEVAGLSTDACVEKISEQFWRFGEDRVIRFQLTGGKKAADYPDLDFEKIRAGMPPVLECQFAVRVGKRWVLR
jgi:DNA repair exonuclease SbcCD nuclease subunit